MCTRESHERAKRESALWRAMTLIGYQHVEADESGPAVTLEVRNCHCQSTLCVEVES